MLPLHHSLRNGDRAIRTLARDKPPTCVQDKSLKPLEYISKYMSIRNIYLQKAIIRFERMYTDFADRSLNHLSILP